MAPHHPRNTISGMGQVRQRIPKLSSRPDPRSGCYYACYRKPNGVPGRKLFDPDRRTSEAMHREWVVVLYHGIVIPDPGPCKQVTRNDSLIMLASAFIEQEKNRVRAEEGRRIGGTVSIRTAYGNTKQVESIVGWCRARFGDRVTTDPFADLMTETEYEAMMGDFAAKLSQSQVNKHRQRFWQLVRFARRRPYSMVFPFGPDTVRKFGGAEGPRQRRLPTVALLKTLLKAATLREQLWIWMGMGLGFGQDDLAHARSAYFDAKSYDMRRGKTRIERYGVMRPRVWALLQAYLKATPRKPDELLFTTAKGMPLVWTAVKTPEELENGTKTHGPKPIPYKRTDSVTQAFRKLKERAGVADWKEGFYVFRHIGATAYGARPGTSLAELRTFLGHGRSHIADTYLKPLTPEAKPLVKWVNATLDRSTS